MNYRRQVLPARALKQPLLCACGRRCRRPNTECAFCAYGGRKAYRRHVGDSCELCGWTPPVGLRGALDIDHIVPISQGGSRNDPSNLQTLCPNCHRVKSLLEARAFRAGLRTLHMARRMNDEETNETTIDDEAAETPEVTPERTPERPGMAMSGGEQNNGMVRG